MFCFLLSALSSGVSLLVITLPLLFLHPLPVSFTCLSAFLYRNHLFTQPVVHFRLSLASYSLILSDFITLMQETSLLFRLATTATNSDRVILFASELCVHFSLHVCTREAALYKLKGKKNLSICYAFLTLTFTYKYSPL